MLTCVVENICRGHTHAGNPVSDRYHPLMKTTAVVISALLLLAPCATAHASPEDPYGDDYVAVAVAPSTGEGGYGSSGTLDDATRIALLQCSQLSSECVIAAAIHHGCVSLALNPGMQWRGGRGPDEATARADALTGLQDATVSGSWCST